MRLYFQILSFVALTSIMNCPVKAETTPPPPPTADYPLLADFDFKSDGDSQSAWKAYPPCSGDVTVQHIEKIPVLRLPCLFDREGGARAYWDFSLPLDLSDCQGIQFQLYCADASPVSEFNAYLRSGDGWYTQTIYPADQRHWNTIVFDKSLTQTEGRPAGWSRIDTLRVAAWRALPKPTEMFIANLGAYGTGASIGMLRSNFSGPIIHSLKAAGLSYLEYEEADITLPRLQRLKVLILPNTESIGPQTVDAIHEYIKQGGKLLAFYTLPSELHSIAGLSRLEYTPAPSGVTFTSIRPSSSPLEGALDSVTQSTANIMKAVPIEGQAAVSAYWYNQEGKPTDYPAIIRSADCIYMSHVYRAANSRLLLVMLANLVPEFWKQSFEITIANLGKPFNSFAEAKNEIHRQAPNDADTGTLLTGAEQLLAKADELLKREAYSEALSAAEEARQSMTEAYCRIQSSEQNEFRAFWCHSAFGLPGKTWDESIRLLADNGFTAIVVNMLWGGSTYYPSEVLPLAPDMQGRTDLLEECLQACKKYGVECHVWKVNWRFGRTSREFIERCEREGRLQVLSDDSERAHWLCPSNPVNQELEINAMLEIVKKYPVEGIHFDYIRYPSTLGCYCEACRKRLEEYCGESIQDWPGDLQENLGLRKKWYEFRRGHITHVVRTVSDRARQINPRIKISAAVFRTWTVDRDEVAQDWKLWCDEGCLDFVCPMNYTGINQHFENWIVMQKEWAGDIPCYPGIGMSVWSDLNIFKLIDQIQITRKHNTRGFVIFNFDRPEMVELCGLGLTRKE